VQVPGVLALQWVRFWKILGHHHASLADVAKADLEDGASAFKSQVKDLVWQHLNAAFQCKRGTVRSISDRQSLSLARVHSSIRKNIDPRKNGIFVVDLTVSCILIRHTMQLKISVIKKNKNWRVSSLACTLFK
jgi:hypothetical protein